MNSINQFCSGGSFFIALKSFFQELKVPVNYLSEEPLTVGDVLKDDYRSGSEAQQLIESVLPFGIVDDAIFKGVGSFAHLGQLNKVDEKYQGLLIFGINLKPLADGQSMRRSLLSEITRTFNRQYPHFPVTIIFRYGQHISFAVSERIAWKQQWREGDKAGKVTMLKDINCESPHSAHLKILAGLAIDPKKVNSFQLLYKYWQSVFSLQTLNNQFYADLQKWFYYASQKISLPYCPEYINEKENTKNFLVRLLARTMFCWFLKEKGLIRKELLELKDWDGNKYRLTNDVEEEEFLRSNSYYRGILQNIFYNALNRKEKKDKKDFGWTDFWHPELNLDWLTDIPYLSGGIFDKLGEDNAGEEIRDGEIRVPNFLFYGHMEEQMVTKGKGAKAKTSVENVEHLGLNGILKSYKFTLDENTPFEEDIALDPEMLGLVFENLLAELDPNLEESTIKSIRKQTGSYYTPRKVILEMVNDSLFLYLSRYITVRNPENTETRNQLHSLVYSGEFNSENHEMASGIVGALDKFKVLDPACGSGAFPMVMLHRIVDILKTTDPDNSRWLQLKLSAVDQAHQADFKKVLSAHMDDYGRKLGIIRDCIYGMDIQPLAVQITKLRFFISLLIDQKAEAGITPMPNIETKIICADSLKNIKPDLFSETVMAKLIAARNRYYHPDISPEDRLKVADEIVEVMDRAFPTFAYQVTGRKLDGINRELIRQWFTHGTLAAPFFNMDFFFPELSASGGFDCVIGNPPYGGTSISDEVQQTLGLGSSDPYGAFIARFLNAHSMTTPLKHGGVLAFIVSDTFMTIKSHLQLRRHLMQNYVHKMLRVHPDTFRATVNTVIMVAERNTLKERNVGHICLMADLTNISIHTQYERFAEVLNLTKGADFETEKVNISNEEFAIYHYPQALIKTNSNLPFFVESPKLFALMNESGQDLKKEIREIGGRQVQVRKIPINGKEIEVVKLGDIAEVKQGIKTGDNKSYIYKNSDAKGNYLDISTYKQFVLTEDDIENIRSNDNLRKDLLENGISNNLNSIRYFNNKYILPIDKGGGSDVEEGLMPSYYIQTEYFIDWSEWAVTRMKNLTIGDRDKVKNHKICSRLQNMEFNFKPGLTFSPTGIYSPTFRLSSQALFESKGSTLFLKFDCSENSVLHMLGVLSSKFFKYNFKAFISHTVETGEKSIESIFYSTLKIGDVLKLVKDIIHNQRSIPRYDYASYEQIEIDKLVYEAYGLNAEDVKEVENWFARRYPRLSAAQKANLRALGKSDDYLELYGLK
jgi:hypothetical protein